MCSSDLKVFFAPSGFYQDFFFDFLQFEYDILWQILGGIYPAYCFLEFPIPMSDINFGKFSILITSVISSGPFYLRSILITDTLYLCSCPIALGYSVPSLLAPFLLFAFQL